MKAFDQYLHSLRYLTNRDIEGVRLLFKHKALSLQQLADWNYNAPRSSYKIASRRVNRMIQLGILQKVGNQYLLTRAAYHLLDEAVYASRSLRFNVGHIITLNELYTRLKTDSRASGWQIIDWENECSVENIIADAYGKFKCGRMFHCFFEVDSGKRDISAAIRDIDEYNELLDAKLYEVFPVVVVQSPRYLPIHARFRLARLKPDEKFPLREIVKQIT